MKILFIEDNLDVLTLLRSELKYFGNDWTIEFATTVHEAKFAIDQFQPDLMFVDLKLPDGSGIEVLELNRKFEKPIPSIIISVVNDPETVLLAIKLGAVGYIQKSNFSPSAIKEAITAFHEGQAPLSGTIAKLILDTIRESADEPHFSDFKLSNRECEILEALSKGFSMKEVAAIFEISPNTVPVNARNIYRKLEAHGKTEAIFIARQNGIIRS